MKYQGELSQGMSKTNVQCRSVAGVSKGVFENCLRKPEAHPRVEHSMGCREGSGAQASEGRGMADGVALAQGQSALLSLVTKVHLFLSQTQIMVA